MTKMQIATAAIAGMLSVAVPVYISHEGVKTTPYLDVVGVPTVCSGDTRNVEKRKYTLAECDERTKKIIEEFGTEVATANPTIVRYPSQWAAHTIFAANIGVGGYKKSSVLRLDLAGQHRLACRYILNYKYAGKKVFQGLVNRRAGTTDKIGEYELCLADAVERDIGLI